VAARKSAVMAALVDPAVLKASIPRCKIVRKISGTKIWAMAEIGFQKWNFTVDSALTMNPIDDGYTVSGDILAGRVRLGRLDSTIHITEQAGRSVIDSKTTITPAQKHSAVIERVAVKVARTITGSFFKNIAALAK
jgi:carbon monoxide dehydrogenase subunit G